MSLARVPSEHCKFGIFNANFPECGAEICNEPLYIYMCILHVHAILSAKKTRMQTIYESVPKSQSSHGNFLILFTSLQLSLVHVQLPLASTHDIIDKEMYLYIQTI